MSSTAIGVQRRCSRPPSSSPPLVLGRGAPASLGECAARDYVDGGDAQDSRVAAPVDPDRRDGLDEVTVNARYVTLGETVDDEVRSIWEAR